MRIIKTFEFDIAIKNPRVSGKRSNIINILKTDYEMKCWEDALIIKVIDESLEMGEIIVHAQYLDGSSTCTIRFDALVIQLRTGELFAGALIENRKLPSLVECSSQTSTIVLNSDLPQVLVEGMKIPVIIGKIIYRRGHDKISASALLLQPDPKTIAYKNIGGEVIGEKVRQLTKAARDYSASFDKIKDKKHVREIMQLFNFPEAKVSAQSKISIFDLPSAEVNEGFYLLADPADKFGTTIIVANLVNQKKQKFIVEQKNLPQQEVITALLLNYINWVSLIIEMAADYEDEAIYDKHKTMWELFKSAKTKAIKDFSLK